MIADRRRQRAGVADGRRLGGGTGWDAHYASYTREFGQVREEEGVLFLGAGRHQAT